MGGGDRYTGIYRYIQIYLYRERKRKGQRKGEKEREKERERERPKRFVRKILDKSAAAKYSNWMKLDKNES